VLGVIDLKHPKAESTRLLYHDLAELSVIFDDENRLVSAGEAKSAAESPRRA
jgi:hypothetical protein